MPLNHNPIFRRRQCAALAIVVAVVISFFAWAINDLDNRQTAFKCYANVVTVEHYDTLWSIVRGNCSGNHIAAIDYHVKVYGTDIFPGQQIFLADNNDCELTNLLGEIYETC